MKRILLVMLTLTAAVVSLQEANAQGRQNNQGLPKVDFQVGGIYKVGQALAIPVKNGGFERSPATSVAVVVWNTNRQIIMRTSLNVAPLQPGASRRVLFVPPQGQTVQVRAIVDPGNRVAETNERNNTTASRH